MLLSLPGVSVYCYPPPGVAMAVGTAILSRRLSELGRDTISIEKLVVNASDIAYVMCVKGLPMGDQRKDLSEEVCRILNVDYAAVLKLRQD